MTTLQTPPTAAPEPTSGEQRAALLRLVLVVTIGVLVAVQTGAGPALAVIAAVVVMIMLHELGHFLTAKWAGMKVTEYFLGFGPRLWSIRKGETEYGIKAIPAGGYVKIIGMSNLEQIAPGDDQRTYRSKPYWRRLSVAVAGSAVHFILAFILIFVLLAFVGLQKPDKLLVGSISRLETGASPAQEAGFQVGDRLVSYDGHEADDWNEMRRYILGHPGQPIEFHVTRDGEPLTLTATPTDLSKVKVRGDQVVCEGDRCGFVGIGPNFGVEKTGVLEGLGEAGSELGRVSWLTIRAIGSIFSPSGMDAYRDQLLGRPVPSNDPEDAPRFLSPVGFGRVASQAAESGLREVLFLLVSINVFVGIFNMAPLLPLDGGHVAVATYERLRSRRGREYRVDVAKLLPLTYAVFLFIVLLGVTSLYLDVFRPASNPFQ